MKKFNTILATALVAVGSLTANANLSETQTRWANLFTNNTANGNKHTSLGYDIGLTADGDLITLGEVHTTANTQKMLFGDTEIGVGSVYGGNSGNLSLAINKIDSEGNVVWSVYSTAGELDNSSSRMAVTADGGCVAFLNMRHSEGDTGTRISLHDALGVDHEVPFDIENGVRSYHGLVIKVAADGGITWVKDIAVNATADNETYPGWTQSSRNIGQGLFAYALDVDNDGNVYIGGRMCAALTIDDVTIQPHNVDTWTGSAQTSVGNMFVMKFDARGNLVKHIESEGAATQESIRQIKVVGNRIYAMTLVAGLANTEYSIGGQSVTTTNNLLSPGLILLDTDLNVTYLKHYTSVASGSTMQVPTLFVNDTYAYLMGTGKFEITIGATAYNTSHVRDAWLFQVDLATGEPMQCYIHQSNQTGFFGAYEAADGYLYVIEYGLTTTNLSLYNGNTVLYKFDQSDLSEPLESATLATHPSTGFGLTIAGTNLYVFDRLCNGSVAGNFINSDLELTTPAYASRLAAFSMSNGAVEALQLDAESLELDPGQSAQLTATFVPENTVKNAVVWTSSNEDVVTVDQEGVVTAVAVAAAPARRADGDDVSATATITATSVSYPDITTSVEVNVKQSPVTGVTDITVASAPTDNKVYTIDGRYMGRSTTGLAAGIYIVGGKKIVVR